jgi:hypothetical protein
MRMDLETTGWDVPVQEHNDALADPEHRLMLAVLEEALVTFRRGLLSTNPRARKAALDVDLWLRSREFDWPFSFESICSTLRIDASLVRRGMADMKRLALTTRRRPRGSMVRRETGYSRSRRSGTLG